MWRKELLKPRTPVSEPTPMATESTTKRNLAREARISRHAMRMAARQESWACVSLCYHKAVAQHDAAVGAFGQRLLVRHQDHGGALFAIQRQQQFQHGAAGGAVQIAGGFVGQQDGRTQREGACQRDALLFAARKLYRVVVEASAQSYALQQFARAFAAAACQLPRIPSASSTFSSAVSVEMR